MDHFQLSQSALGHVRNTIVERDPLAEWSLAALVAGINVCVFQAPVPTGMPIVNLLRAAVLGRQSPIEFDRHLLHGTVTMPATAGSTDPIVVVAAGPLDDVPLLRSRRDLMLPELAVSIDARETLATETGTASLLSGDLFAGLENLILPPEWIAAWQQQAFALPISPENGEYALQMVRAAQPGDSNAASHTRAYVTTGPEAAALRDLLRVARASAFLHGESEVRDRTIKAAALHVLRHRLIRNDQARAVKFELHDLTRAIIDSVPRPSKKKRRDSEAMLPPSAPASPPPAAPPSATPPPYYDVPPPEPVALQPAENASPYAPSYFDQNWHQPPPPLPGQSAPHPAPMYDAAAYSTPMYQQPMYQEPVYQQQPQQQSLPMPRVRRSRNPSFVALLLAYIIGGAAGLWIGSKVLVYVRDELGWRWNVKWVQPREAKKPIEKAAP
jgi:hypothetical protein